MNPDPRNRNRKMIRLPLFNPRINAGASIPESEIDILSFTVGLMCGSD